MLKQDQNQGGQRRRTCATDQMLRKTLLPVIEIALCVLIVIAVSACKETHESASDSITRQSASTDKEWLGKQLFFDTNLSEPAGQACAACHAAQVGWTGPDEMINQGGAVYEGAVTGRFGNRKPPSKRVRRRQPRLAFRRYEWLDGCMFWDGRATGLTLGDPLAEQAMGPFLNPLEQNNTSADMLVDK